MSDYKKSSEDAEHGERGELLLVRGKDSAMRKWVETPEVNSKKSSHAHPYETLGYVIQGKAMLYIEGAEIELKRGDSWVVPAQTEHHYEIMSDFEAVEVTTPPARES